MTTRRRWHLPALAAAALLAASCGGGDSVDAPLATRVVSFGDSLSDLGTYAVATEIPLGGVKDGLAPYLAGRFTTNTHTGYTTTSNTNTAAIWVEWVAARVGVPITQAMFGFATFRRACPAALSVADLADTCTAYGQGGSRVTDPNGVNHSQGALTDPLVTQVAAHLTKFGSFDGRDIVFVFAGGNDLLVNLGMAQADPTKAPQAVAAMQQAGTELATLIKEQIAAKGAKRIALLTLSDLYVTSSPYLSAADPGTKAFVRQLIGAFNTAALTAVDGGTVRVIDTNVFFTGLLAKPADYGITNVTTTACDPDKVPPAVGGSALFCNGAAAALFTAAGLPNLNTLRTGASASYLYADGLHPTTGGHKALGDYVIGQIKGFGWLPNNL